MEKTQGFGDEKVIGHEVIGSEENGPAQYTLDPVMERRVIWKTDLIVLPMVRDLSQD